MTKTQAIKEAIDRTERTGITWLPVRIKKRFTIFGKYRYEVIYKDDLTKEMEEIKGDDKIR